MSKLTFKQIKNFIKQNNDLLEFTNGLLSLIKAANPQRFENPLTHKSELMLDKLSRLIVGDEICAAVAIINNEFFYSTNQNNHLDERIKYQKYYKVLDVQENEIGYHYKGIEKRGYINQSEYYPFNFKVQFRTKLIHQSQTGNKITRKDSNDVLFLYNTKTNKYDVKGDLNPIISKSEHQINSVKGTISVNTILWDDPKKIFDAFNTPEGQNWVPLFYKEMLCEQDPLNRRIAQLFMGLAAIAKYKVERPDMEGQVEKAIETNKHWAMFLNASLTYELSKQKEYNKHIIFSDSTNTAYQEIDTLYHALIEDFQLFKKANGTLTTLQTLESWFITLENFINSLNSPAPIFIKNNPDVFVQLFRKYVRNLVELEFYIRETAKPNDFFSEILIKQSLADLLKSVRLIEEGTDKEHAEMRILEVLLKEQKSLDHYLGITMLCCAQCTFCLKQFGCEHMSRGSHAILYGGWTMPAVIRENPVYLKKFLGEPLYNKYLAFKDIQVQFNKEKFFKGEVAFEIINQLSGFNNRSILEELGLDPNLEMEYTKNLHPSDVNLISTVNSDSNPILNNNKFQEALIHFNFKPEEKTNFQKGEGLFEKKNYSEAIDFFNLALNTSENKAAKIYCIIGHCYYHLGEFDKATLSYQKAINENDDTLHYAQSWFEKAKAQLDNRSQLKNNF